MPDPDFDPSAELAVARVGTSAFSASVSASVPTNRAEIIAYDARRFVVPGWLSWLSARILSGVLTIVGVSVIVFAATQALPSDPARVILGADATEQSVAILRTRLGLDRPILVQYAGWAENSLRGDLGDSLDSDLPASGIIADRFANSIALIVVVLAVTIPISLWLGLELAARADSLRDHVAVATLIVLKALPPFIIGIALVFAFSTNLLPILPAVSLIEPGSPALAQPIFLVLPAATLTLAVAPYLTRVIRASAIEALSTEYVAASRLRGLPERRILWRHVMPNTLVPAIQGLAMVTRVLLGGALLVEVVFSYPGLGTALNAAIAMRDLPVIQGITLLMAASVVVINLAADFATVWLTPKLRTARSPSVWPGTRALVRLKGRL